VDQDVAERDDPRVLADPAGRLGVHLREPAKRLPDDFELASTAARTIASAA